MAAQGGHQEIVTLLLIHGANTLSKTKVEIIHSLFKLGFLFKRVFILNLIFILNILTISNFVTFFFHKMLKLVFQFEFNTSNCNNMHEQNGFTAHDIATQQGHVVIAELLEEYSKQKQQHQQQLLQHEKQQNKLQQQHNETQKCWETSNNTDETVCNATKPPQSLQRLDLLSEQRNNRLPRLLHLLPHQRNRIRCSRSCDKMLSRGELTRLQLHNEVISNKLNKGNNKGILNKVGNNKVKAPSVSKQDFLQTPHNSPMRHKNAE